MHDFQNIEILVFLALRKWTDFNAARLRTRGGCTGGRGVGSNDLSRVGRSVFGELNCRNNNLNQFIWVIVKFKLQYISITY
jgi:hypothetical protein